MTLKEKQLLLIDLCARLPYGVVVDNPDPAGSAWDEVIDFDICAKTVTLLYDGRVFSIDDVKPYLRPMSSMTEEEKDDYHAAFDADMDKVAENIRKTLDGNTTDLYHFATPTYRHIDWLNAHHFDYRGLIEKGLALEAPEGMYKTE